MKYYSGSKLPSIFSRSVFPSSAERWPQSGATARDQISVQVLEVLFWNIYSNAVGLLFLPISGKMV
jgi:hypothetical protein